MLLPVMVFSQLSGSSSANVVVRLNPLLSISVVSPSVVLEYDTKSDYLDGVSTSLEDHLETFSTIPYEVTARYISSDLDASTLAIEGSGSFGKVKYFGISLSDTPQRFMESSVGGGRKFHNVKYSVDKPMWDKEMKDYDTVVLYEIVPL